MNKMASIPTMEQNTNLTWFFFLMVITTAVSCGPGTASSGGESLTGEAILAHRMPAAMADGIIKAAVVCGLTMGDSTQQFLEGCVAEGRALGFTVDTFSFGGDNERCREIISRIAAADYDGLILSSVGAEFSQDILKPVLERGIKVVAFDAAPQGEMPSEVTSTVQDDEKLAELSLEALLSLCEKRPARVIRAWTGPGIPLLDRRQRVYDRFVGEGRIEELALVRPRITGQGIPASADLTYARSEIREALAAVLPKFPPGTVDAVWASCDEFAKGCVDALEDGRRRDIKVVSIDISNSDIALMLEYTDQWVAAAAVDTKLSGRVNMRLLAAKFAGEPTPETYIFEARLVETSRLNRDTNMANIAEAVPGWESGQGLFDSYPWMAELKAAGRGPLFHSVGSEKGH